MSVWQIKQLGKLRETDPRMVDEAVDQLLTQEVELREKLVIGAYLDEDINLGKAAELLGVHPVELRRRFMNQGIPVRIGSESFEALQAEAAVADQARRKR